MPCRRLGFMSAGVAPLRTETLTSGSLILRQDLKDHQLRAWRLCSWGRTAAHTARELLTS